MIKIIKKNWYYLIIFICVFLFYWLFFSFGTRGDSINNYGFSHAIRIGEVPYRDFNMVSTPLYAFIMSIGLFIWDNHIVFLLEQSILFTAMFYMISKINGKMSIFVLLSFLSFGCLGFNTTYNFFELFLLILLVYLEKYHNEKDLLIGFVIGLAIMTKHTIGFFCVIPSIIFYCKKQKKILKRIVGVLIPCIYFLVYFLFHKSFYKLLDLCLFGLFDFGSKNKILSFSFIFLAIVLLLIFIYCIIKDKNNIINYYLLCSIFFVIPICDLHHFFPFFICFLILIFQYFKNKWFLVIYVFFSAFWFFSYSKLFLMNDFVFTPTYEHINYSRFNKLYIKEANEVYNLIDGYGDDVVLLSYDTMIYEIINNKKIDYYSVFLNGNFGYNGIDKMIKKISNEHNKYIFIEKKAYNDGIIGKTQFPSDICDYIFENYEFVADNKGYLIYYIK